MNLGMGLLPDDRKAEGIIADLSVRENIILAMQAKRGMFKLLPMSRQNEIADKYIELLQIKTASRETLIGQLSGGNQQKVILARWLATDPEFLILDEPTRGIDVGTKTEIQKLVIELADQGKSLIFISSEIEEMLRTCSKLVVLRDGQEVGEITEELAQGHVMQSIAGGGRNEQFKKLVSQPLFLPISCMILVMAAVTIIYDVMAGNFAFNFFTISIRNGVLYGRIIDILNRGSEIAVLAIGMTLVVSCSAGTDISVGSVMSLAASFCCMLLAGYGVSSTNSLAAPLIVGVLGGILMGCACGAFNGFLVSYLNVQPMVATLILFSAARAIGLLLCNNMIVYVRDDSFKIFGGYLGFMPTPIVVAIVCILITSLVLRKTALGLYIQSVGINKKASRIAGINSERIIFLCYVVCGLCAGIAGIVASSRISSADSNNIGLNFELDAILAVALGGNSLGGGKFRLAGSIIGALHHPGDHHHPVCARHLDRAGTGVQGGHCYHYCGNPGTSV